MQIASQNHTKHIYLRASNFSEFWRAKLKILAKTVIGIRGVWLTCLGWLPELHILHTSMYLWFERSHFIEVGTYFAWLSEFNTVFLTLSTSFANSCLPCSDLKPGVFGDETLMTK